MSAKRLSLKTAPQLILIFGISGVLALDIWKAGTTDKPLTALHLYLTEGLPSYRWEDGRLVRDDYNQSGQYLPCSINVLTGHPALTSKDLAHGCEDFGGP